jgi:hypothetical protein
MGTSKSPRRCRNCGHDRDWHDPACQRCQPHRRCTYFRPPQPSRGVVMICLRETRFVYSASRSTYARGNEFTAWADVAEALEAERELCAGSCGPHCLGRRAAKVLSAVGRNAPGTLAGSRSTVSVIACPTSVRLGRASPHRVTARDHPAKTRRW